MARVSDTVNGMDFKFDNAVEVLETQLCGSIVGIENTVQGACWKISETSHFYYH